MWQITCAEQQVPRSQQAGSNCQISDCPRLKCTCNVINHHANTSFCISWQKGFPFPDWERHIWIAFCTMAQLPFFCQNVLSFNRYTFVSISYFYLLVLVFPSRKWMRQAMQSCNWRSKYFPCFSKRFVSVQRSSIFDLEIKPILDRIGPEQGRGSNIEYWRVELGKYWLGINPSEPISHIARRRLQPRIKNRSTFDWLPINMSTSYHLEIEIAYIWRNIFWKSLPQLHRGP